MALTSVFYDGTVTETDRAKNRGGVPDYGVYGIEDFKVIAHPSIANAVLVKAGKAHGFGVTDTATADQPVQCGTISSGTRWDLITVRRNWQPAAGGPSTLEAVPGGAVAEIPTSRKVGPGVEDDQPLALVKWKAGLSAPEQIIDLRVWTSNGGLYAKDDLVRSYLTGAGTRISINGIDWVCTLGANDVPTWRAGMTSGKESITIATNSSFVTKFIKYPITYPVPPVPVISIASNVGGDASRLIVSGYTSTTTGFTAKLQTSDNVKVGVTYDISVNWVAYPAMG